MAEHKSVHIFVEIAKGDQKKLEFHHDHVTGREIKERAGAPAHGELFVVREGKFHAVKNDETIHIKDGEHFAVIPPGAIHYTVDDEPQWTTDKVLTPVMIMKYAGVDPDHNYLVELKEHNKKESFKDDPEKRIEMHNNMKFITHFTGPKPVSNE